MMVLVLVWCVDRAAGASQLPNLHPYRSVHLSGYNAMWCRLLVKQGQVIIL